MSLALFLVALTLVGVGVLVTRHTVVEAGMARDAALAARARAEETLAAARTELRQLRARPVEPATSDLTPEQARALLEEVQLPDLYPGVPAGKVRVFDREKCQHCGGLHARACPRLRRIVYSETGKPAEVEFWAHGRWPAEDVLWLEDVTEAAGLAENEEVSR